MLIVYMNEALTGVEVHSCSDPETIQKDKDELLKLYGGVK
jgi:hypothetical protein